MVKVNGVSMDIIFITFISIVLAVDAFVVSISCGISHSGINIPFCGKVSVFFGVTQALFFGGGYLLGSLIKAFAVSIGPWIAFFILVSVGVKFVWESSRNWKRPRKCRLITTRILMVLSVATSMDALAIGIAFPLLDIPVLIPMVVVGLVTFWLSFMGVLIGDGLRGRFDKIAEMAAGLTLIGLGMNVLFNII